jgi:homogentisate 1,2-dioxygenase
MNTPWNLVIPHTEGMAARQAHADTPAGTFERELGRDGFSGAATHMYHRNPPTAWLDIDGPIRPRAFDPSAAVRPTSCPWNALALVHNANLRIRYWRIDRSMDHLVRNADGDDLLFVHQGAGELFCDYGHISLTVGDYLIVPRGTMWRLDVETATDILLIEATGNHYRLPERGMLGRHAPFDPGVLAKPAIDDTFTAQQGPGRWTVRVKRGSEIGHITYPFNPLDAVGWKGDLYPVRLNMRDVRAISSHRLHLPPSVRTSFVADRFIVCTLAPRPVETDPGAMKLPFFHNNEDYDEVIFYHSGAMGSRGSAVRPGMMTFHPIGFTHGPHPQTLPHMFKHPATMFESYSIAVDAMDQLQVADLPEGCEVPAFSQTWNKAIEFAPDAAPALAK